MTCAILSKEGKFCDFCQPRCLGRVKIRRELDRTALHLVANHSCCLLDEIGASEDGAKDGDETSGDSGGEEAEGAQHHFGFRER